MPGVENVIEARAGAFSPKAWTYAPATPKHRNVAYSRNSSIEVLRPRRPEGRTTILCQSESGRKPNALPNRPTRLKGDVRPGRRRSVQAHAYPAPRAAAMTTAMILTFRADASTASQPRGSARSIARRAAPRRTGRDAYAC